MLEQPAFLGFNNILECSARRQIQSSIQRINIKKVAMGAGAFWGAGAGIFVLAAAVLALNSPHRDAID